MGSSELAAIKAGGVDAAGCAVHAFHEVDFLPPLNDDASWELLPTVSAIVDGEKANSVFGFPVEDQHGRLAEPLLEEKEAKKEEAKAEVKKEEAKAEQKKEEAKAEVKKEEAKAKAKEAEAESAANPEAKALAELAKAREA